MKLTELADKLANDVTIVSQNCTTVNSGGCGVFAALLGEQLETKGYKPKYVIMSISPRSVIQDARAELQATENQATLYDLFWYVGFIHSHVVIKLGKKYIDAEGKLVDWKKNYRIGLTIDLQTLKKWNDEREIWNHEFKRGKELPKIKKLIKEVMQNY